MNIPQAMHTAFKTKLSALLLLLCLCMPQVLRAQSNYSLKGKVIDQQTGEGLIGANVRLLSSSGTQLAGVSTDVNGSFSLRQIPSGNHKLQVSYIGYEEYGSSVQVPSSEKELTIRLAEDSKQLATVVVEARAADMTMKGDTLVFNANAYRMGTGSTLEDLIKRLPGAQIDDSGNIVINGKTVQKIMVDGKEFFSGDTKTATKNLPAEVIEKIEMLDRSSDAARMTGFDDGNEETVLNLSFKEEYKEGLFGNAFAGYGTNNRFEANATLNNFSGANRLTFIGGGNNTNNKGMSDISSGAEQNKRPPRKSAVGVTTSAVAALDIAQTLHEKVEVEGNARYGYSDKVVEAENSIEYLRSSGSNTSGTETAQSRTQEHSAGTNLRFTYKPNSRTEMVFQPNFFWGKSIDQSNEETKTFSALQEELTQSQISNHTTGSNLRTGGTFDISRKLTQEGRVISLQLGTNFTKSDSEGYYSTSFSNNTNSTLNEKLSLLQNDHTQRTSFSARLSYVEPLGKGFFLQGLVQWKNDRRNGVRDVYTPDAAGNYTTYEDAYASSFINNLSSYNVGVNLQKKATSYDLTIGVGIEPIEMKTWFPLGTTETITKSKFNFAPQVRLNVRPDKQTMWRLDYSGQADMPDVYMMMPVTDPTNPLQVTMGNSELAPSFTHQLRSFFRTYNPETRLAINLFTRASYTLNDVASSITYDENTGRQTITYRNVDGNASWRMFGMASMPFFNPLLTLNVGSRIFFTHQLGFVEERENVSNTWVLAPLMQLSYAKGIFYARFNASAEYTGTTNSIDQSRYNTWLYQTGLESSIDLPLNLKLESDVTFRKRTGYGAGYDQSEWLWNAALSYSFLNKQATIRLKAYDILGNETGISRTATALDITDSRTNVLGRYVMVHFIYSFSSFSKGASQSDFQSFGPGGSRGLPPPL